MSRLLRADAVRMKKAKEFRLCLAAFCVIVMMIVFGTWREKRMLAEYGDYALDAVLFQFTAISGYICAVLVSLFVGADYSDGTIRNKLIVGHRRSNIYFSNLIVTAAAGVIMSAAAAALTAVLGIPLFGGLKADLSRAAAMLLCGLLIGAVYSALYTMLASLIPGKASAVVACLVVSLVMLFAASWLESQLSEPEMYQSFISFTVNGEPVLSDPEPNPLYIDGVQREIYEFLYDLLPMGQASQISNFECERMARFPVLSVFVIIVTSVIGCLGFGKKDLK